MKDMPDSSREPRAEERITKLAVMAVGGQGGGVLTNWIEAVARANGQVCQATSVAGVSQRTGATIYYLEMAPDTGRRPVFSLAPATGDVDILIAAEMMEAGRAIIRGFVTPDRTTLIASTHRMLAVSEKSVPGDGIADPEEVRAAADIAAADVVMFDMERLAVENGSVISSSLLGALAASDALPFPRDSYEDAIRAGGRGVEASLRAFAAAYDRATGQASATPAGETTSAPGVAGPDALMADWAALTDRVAAYPAPVAALARPGLQKVVEFLDPRYGAAYLDRVDGILALDDGPDHALTANAAKYVANAMAYDDVIRVADLKTRGPRFDRIRKEMGADEDRLMHVTEFMHPRAEEIAGMLPARLGARVENSPRAMRLLTKLFDRGRRYRSDGVLAFSALWLLGGLRRYRLRTLRHSQEMAHMQAWLDAALAARPGDYALAVEILKCRRLIKGYSDTHARGLSKYDRVMDGIAMVRGRDDAADWARRLREAALLDEKGEALDGALATIRSFREPDGDTTA